MVTEQLYYKDPYLQQAEANVIQLQISGNGVLFELDKTIFYPEGGGQPSDQGEVVGDTGSIKVESVRFDHGRIIHQGKMIGSVGEGNNVKLQLKWQRRFRNMRVHSAGHLIHDVLMTIHPDLKPVKGNHGDKAFLEYVGILAPTAKDELEKSVNEAVQKDIPIRTWNSSYEEVTSLCKAVPANLPKDKQIRLLRIGEFEPMPDGGVQVKSTKEIGKVIIHHIVNTDTGTTIRYGIVNTSE